MKKLLFVLLVLSVTVKAQVPSYVPSNGLVAYYPFNGNANDASGNGNNGVVNGATLTSDRFGVGNNALNLSGALQYLGLPAGTITSLNITGNFTVSFWIKTLSNTSPLLVCGDNVNSPYPGYFSAINGGNVGTGKIGISTNGIWYSSNSTINNNQWRLVSYVFGSGVFKLYIDGILENTFNNVQAPNSWNGNRVFGGRSDLFNNNNTNYIGSFDDIAIYNRALTQQEVTQLYTGQVIPSNVPTNGLVGYWPFNGNANDASGNGNNGTVNGATLTSDRNGNAGNAYSFNGSNFISVADNDLLDLTNDFTISTWFNPSSFPGNQFGGPINLILCKRQNIPSNILDGFGGYGVWESNGAHVFSTQSYPNAGSQNYSNSTYNILTNTWYNYVVTYNDFTDTLKYFLNGNLIFNKKLSLEVQNNNYNMFIGALGSTPSYFWNGKLDDIAIYNRALSQSEITQLYNANSCIANITTPDTTICRGSSVTLNAAAVNSASVTDINGNVYPTVNIGTQTWMQKNLNVSKYKNGDIIPQVTNATQWAALTTGAWCWYNNDSVTYAATYGKLYNWYAVNDQRGLAPEGWRVPSDGEWNKLVKYLDPTTDTTLFGYQNSSAGGSLKETGTSHWLTPNTGANNNTNFTALPGGGRGNQGAFGNIGLYGTWWTSTVNDIDVSYNRNLYNQSGDIIRYYSASKPFGASVRCLKNTPITYLWSTGATTPSITVSPTVTTKYYCTVSDGINTCKDSVTVTVSTITTNLITADTIKVCGTSATISATTGLASYAWSNGANTASTTVTSTGWYKCTASNGACTAKDSVYVSLFNPKITQNDTTVCAGTPLTLTVNNNTALTSSLPANLRNGLVGYWPFNGNANDESGNGNNLIANGVTSTTDRFGNNNSALNFINNSVNSSNYLKALNSATFRLPQYTFSVWLKCSYFYPPTSSFNYQQIISYSPQWWNYSVSYGMVMTNQSNIGVEHWTTTNFYQGTGASNGPINIDEWNFAVATYDGSNLKFYLNGIFISEISASLSYDNQTQFLVGVRGDGPFPGGYYGGFNGVLDDLACYNRALSANEIQQLYLGTSYLWSTTATTPSINVTPTANTSYIATVSNGISTCKDTVKITVAPITTNLITADTIKVCGTSTSISATTGLSSYAWSNGANTASTTVTSSGWYKCTASNGACTAKDSVYVSLFNPKITQNDTTVCAGASLILKLDSAFIDLRNGLVAFYPLDGNGNDFNNMNNGSINRNITFVADRNGNPGKAMQGGSGYITAPSSVFQYRYNQQFSVSLWFTTNGITSGRILSTENPEGNFRIAYYGDVNQLNVAHGDYFIVPLNNNTWTHLVWTNNNGQEKIYLNGQLTATQTETAFEVLRYGAPFTIGAKASPSFDLWNGKIDDVGIWSKVLTDNEVNKLYNNSISNNSSYLWSTGATTQSITVTPTATTSYIATVSNGINTCKDTVKITVANITSLSPTTIFGAVDVCASIGGDTASTPVNYKINKVANAASYVWTVPSGATLLSGQGDTSIMVRFRSSFVSGAITVKSVSKCNISSALKSVTVYKRVAAAPTAIQNQFTPTSIAAVTNVTGSVSQIYRIKKVLYATSYNWFLNRGTNATITHINATGVNDTAVIVTFASCFVKDTLSVKSVNPCSISAAKTVIMSASTTPATVSVIGTQAGDFAVCIGSSKSFTAVPNTPSATQTAIAKYRWTVPANSIITSATTDSATITVSFNTGFTGGSISVKGISSCNVVGTTATTSVLQFLPPTPASIGSSTNSYNACINSSVTYTAIVGTATTAQAPAASFRWTRPNNTTITSASADSSSITIRFNTGYTGGVISVKSRSRCGTLSAARTQALTHTGCALGTKLSQPITTTNNNSFEVSLYPNPTANAFKLLIKNNKVAGTISSTSAIVKVIDIQGRMMKSFQANTNQVIAIGNELKPGVYMVEVRLGEEVKTIRAVKF